MNQFQEVLDKKNDPLLLSIGEGNMATSLLYVIPDEAKQRQNLASFVREHSYLRFVSLVGVDFLGNDTDERIPVEYFLKNVDEIFEGGVQTDGSSVNLPGIADINDAKVDFVIDPDRKWFVDYNKALTDENGNPIGTIRIPVFFRHHDTFVCSRSILRDTIEMVRREIKHLVASDNLFCAAHNINPADIADVYFTLGTELEFWVSSPSPQVSHHELKVTQALKESYWKRTRGEIRTCLEESLLLLQQYGLEPEMGHKEVGGVRGRITEEGRLHDVMEQLEIDWRFSDPLQAADNDILARFIIKDIFMRHGLSATFVAKPVEGIAGNGKHMHIGMGIILKDGRRINLFSPFDQSHYLSDLGYGAIMGLLRHWEVVNPFVSHSNSALKRLQPGFEAPVSIVASLGRNPQSPSRNRTVLVCLVRGTNQLSTRFEVRAPNPHTNTYLAAAAMYLAMRDGMRYAAGKEPPTLHRELAKKRGDRTPYLEEEREYLSEEDIFAHVSPEERERRFGKTPATVWEVISPLREIPPLYDRTPFTPPIVRSFYLSALAKWVIDIRDKEIPETVRELAEMHRFHDQENALDAKRWNEFEAIRAELIKDDERRESLATRLTALFNEHNYAKASDLLILFRKRLSQARDAYQRYVGNII